MSDKTSKTKVKKKKKGDMDKLKPPAPPPPPRLISKTGRPRGYLRRTQRPVPGAAKRSAPSAPRW